MYDLPYKLLFVAVCVLLLGCPTNQLQERDSGIDPPAADAADASDAVGMRGCSIFPDNCGAGRNCYSTITDRGLEHVCLSYDASKSRGASCERVDDCQSGDRCFEGTCRKVCDPSRPAGADCADGQVCLGLNARGYDLAWGVCLARSDECTPWPNDDCGEGNNCYRRKQGMRCLAFDASASPGDPCDASPDCNERQVCLKVDGASGSDAGAAPARRCYVKCDDRHPCEAGRCEPISSLSHGACMAENSGS